MYLQLTDREHELLLEMLHERMSELRGEIHRTEVQAFKEELKVSEELLAAVIAKLESRPPSTG
jgi:hypothetical protein